MSEAQPPDLSGFSMIDLFRVEVEAQVALLNEGLLALEQGSALPADATRLETLMRAAHSVKGAARIVDLGVAVTVAHALEDCFVAAQKGRLIIDPNVADQLLKGADLLSRISKFPDPLPPDLQTAIQKEIDEFIPRLAALTAPPPVKAETPADKPTSASVQSAIEPVKAISTDKPTSSPASAGVPGVNAPPNAVSPDKSTGSPAGASIQSANAGTGEVAPNKSSLTTPPERSEPDGSASKKASPDRIVRLSADSLNRMLGFIGEGLVETRWYAPFSASLLQLKRRQGDLSRLLEKLQSACIQENHEGLGSAKESISEARTLISDCQVLLNERLTAFDQFSRRHIDLSERLYREAVGSRMRPFSDGVGGFPRMVRDLARRLDKRVHFEVEGKETGIDRELLERLEAPLTHLLRNALDHGIENPAERLAAGKSEEAHLTLSARHRAGRLHIIVSDDGRGVNLKNVATRVIERRLSSPEIVERMNEAELLDFLFLPGFSTTTAVSEISGRGVGLDIVRHLAHEMGGAVQIENTPGAGTRFHLHLPITLSLLHALLVEIGGVPFAIPLTRIERVIHIDPDACETLEGRRHVSVEGQPVGLIEAAELLEMSSAASSQGSLPAVIIGEGNNRYGLLLDRLLGERRLMVRPVDPRFGRLRDIHAVSLLDDGSPILILDVDDLTRSIEIHLAGGRLKGRGPSLIALKEKRGRVLVVDDSLTVREMERQILKNAGYDVVTAVDGIDGLNALHEGYSETDLLVTDVDMPRMSGIELTRKVRSDNRLRHLPIIIVSYKDREEDRLLGLEAGANAYLTKSSFHNDAFIGVVRDLIGESGEGAGTNQPASPSRDKGESGNSRPQPPVRGASS
ncbi:MAG: hybrid sensor histidine kinase/response regulator [Candidatus Ozemobacteraceae bacterium]